VHTDYVQILFGDLVRVNGGFKSEVQRLLMN
jgi:hypothetical protein